MDPARKRPAPRLFVILARGSQRAVVFCRGPSKQVQLIGWNRANDSFTPGQWFNGRIYERRCDLTPSGNLLVYFSAKHHGPDPLNINGTVISRPPYLTALARWPKGDAWGGGGLFYDEKTLCLNHSPRINKHDYCRASEIAKESGLTIKPLGDHAGHGEDSPIYETRRQRDGWRLVREGVPDRKDHKRGVALDPSQVWEKIGPSGWRIEEQCHGFFRPGKPTYHLMFRLIDASGQSLVDLGEADWADWDRDDLVYAKAGCIYRLAAGDVRLSGATLLHDFRGTAFAHVEAPEDAAYW